MEAAQPLPIYVARKVSERLRNGNDEFWGIEGLVGGKFIAFKGVTTAAKSPI